MDDQVYALLPWIARRVADYSPTARVNAVCFSLLWTTAPILVSVTSFFVYVAQGNALTIGTAFTVSGAVFSFYE